MKRSTKFWIVISTIAFILLQYKEWFRETELIILIIIIAFYIIVSFVMLFLYVCELEHTDKKFLKINFLYWILYIPIIKFNNWLNSL